MIMTTQRHLVITRWMVCFANIVAFPFSTAKAIDEEAKLSPLHKAVIDEDLSKAKALLAKGADVEAREFQGKTPLHLAAYKQREMVALLIANQANVNDKDNKGLTPLHIAALGGDIEIIESLVSNHADVNAKGESGET